MRFTLNIQIILRMELQRFPTNNKLIVYFHTFNKTGHVKKIKDKLQKKTTWSVPGILQIASK